VICTDKSAQVKAASYLADIVTFDVGDAASHDVVDVCRNFNQYFSIAASDALGQADDLYHDTFSAEPTW
jgi:hypothetical protein